ncbi:uncharacterized protein LOC120416186 [Culex pipiens pallens]|uniref:uncharacterized protein LOC120416186 n=1 Tax=Culex pipiens pallens TaxID=42434 RepID=UPI001953B292|nr:uncharacterized protein LOC120416186 [Culex pipiens pallens]
MAKKLQQQSTKAATTTTTVQINDFGWPLPDCPRPITYSPVVDLRSSASIIISSVKMKVLTVSMIVTSICFQTIAALWCMQGATVDKNGDKSTGNEVEKMPEVAECGAGVALASTALLFAVKPNTISFPSGDYKCYHLKYEDKNSDASTIIKGCIYSSLNVCDGKFTSKKTNEVFCSQCSEDGCNSGGRFGSSLTLLSLAVGLAYLLR